MTVLRKLRHCREGSVGLEFGMALPILVVLMIGILQYGLVLNANGSMRNAMGEGLRLAKVNPAATNSEVLSRTRSTLVGVDPNAVTSLTFARGTSNNTQTGTMTMQVTLTPIIPFAPIPPIVLNQTKRVYLPS